MCQPAAADGACGCDVMLHVQAAMSCPLLLLEYLMCNWCTTQLLRL